MARPARPNAPQDPNSAPRTAPRRARRITAPPTAHPPGSLRHASCCATRRSRRQAHRVSCCDHSRTYGCSATPSHRPTHISTQGVSEHHQSLKVSKSQSLKVSKSQSLKVSKSQSLKVSESHVSGSQVDTTGDRRDGAFVSSNAPLTTIM